MKWSTEAKVGAFTLAGLIATAIVLAQLSNFVFFGKKGYDVYGIFPEVNGLAQKFGCAFTTAFRFRKIPISRSKRTA